MYVSISQRHKQVKEKGNDCWPKFKVRLLERAKLDSFGRAKLDTLSNRKGRGAVDFQAISHWPGNRAPESSLSDYASMLRCRARQLARPVATGVATIATPNPIGRDKAFPSPKYVSSSEATEAMGDPFAPPVRLSARGISAGRLFRTDEQEGCAARPDSSDRDVPQGRRSHGSLDESRATRSSSAFLRSATSAP